MSNDTEPFWTTPPKNWRHDVEHALNRLDAFYITLSDLMPTIATAAALATIVIATPHH